MKELIGRNNLSKPQLLATIPSSARRLPQLAPVLSVAALRSLVSCAEFNLCLLYLIRNCKTQATWTLTTKTSWLSTILNPINLVQCAFLSTPLLPLTTTEVTALLPDSIKSLRLSSSRTFMSFA